MHPINLIIIIISSSIITYKDGHLTRPSPCLRSRSDEQKEHLLFLINKYVMLHISFLALIPHQLLCGPRTDTDWSDRGHYEYHNYSYLHKGHAHLSEGSAELLLKGHQDCLSRAIYTPITPVCVILLVVKQASKLILLM